MDLGPTVESIQLKQVSQPFLNAASAKIQWTWAYEHIGQKQGQEEKPDFIFPTI